MRDEILSAQEHKFINEVYQRIASEIRSKDDPFIFWLKKYLLVYSGRFDYPADLKHPASLNSRLARERERSDPVHLIDLELSRNLLAEAVSCLLQSQVNQPESKENVNLIIIAREAQDYLGRMIEEKLHIRKVQRQNNTVQVTPLVALIIVVIAISKGYLDMEFLSIPMLLMWIGDGDRDRRIQYNGHRGVTRKFVEAFVGCNQKTVHLVGLLPNKIISMVGDDFKNIYQRTLADLNQQTLSVPLKVEGRFFHTLRIMQQAEKAEGKVSDHLTCAICLDGFTNDKNDKFSGAYYSLTEIKSPQESPYQGPYHRACLSFSKQSKDPLTRRNLIRDSQIGLPVLVSLAYSVKDLKDLESKSPHRIKLENNGSISLQACDEPDLESGSNKNSTTLVNRKQPLIWNVNSSSSDKPELDTSAQSLGLEGLKYT